MQQLWIRKFSHTTGSHVKLNHTAWPLLQNAMIVQQSKKKKKKESTP